MKLFAKSSLIAAALFAGVAFAQTPPADAPKGPHGPGGHGMEAGKMHEPRDCSKVPAERQKMCETRNKALEKCKDKTARDEHRKCMMENMPRREGQGPGPGAPAGEPKGK
jgi:Spy/CpxP family protein refolding chaperone